MEMDIKDNKDNKHNKENISTEKSIRAYKKWLERTEMSSATIDAYLYTISDFFSLYKTFNKYNLLAYKQTVIDKKYSPRTVNARINALNKYSVYINRKDLKLTSIKVQNKPFIENVITIEDYRAMIKIAKKTNLQNYFIIKYLASTGARVSELIKLKVEHVNQGYMDLLSKGSKYRRVYIPSKLRTETLQWLNDIGRTEGSLFFNKNGVTIAKNGITYILKKTAVQVNESNSSHKIDLLCVYPHSFRHLFAIEFLKKRPDSIVLLSDLLGHSSLETTRIYTRMTSVEQKDIIDATIDWC